VNGLKDLLLDAHGQTLVEGDLSGKRRTYWFASTSAR
jgi:hypothetical protein